MKTNCQKNAQSGQAVLEYILLLSIVVSLFVLASKRLSDMNILGTLAKPFKNEYRYVYQYGHKDARGQDDGGPKYIPQYNSESDTQNFRIFINPPINE